MPQPRLAAERTRAVAAPAPEPQRTVYCAGCHRAHGLDVETRERWLRYVGITDEAQLQHLNAFYRHLDVMLRAVGPLYDACPPVGDGGALEEILRTGQDLIDILDSLLSPSDDDLGWMDVE
jgi:hypothetical protein